MTPPHIQLHLGASDIHYNVYDWTYEVSKQEGRESLQKFRKSDFLCDFQENFSHLWGAASAQRNMV